MSAPGAGLNPAELAQLTAAVLTLAAWTPQEDRAWSIVAAVIAIGAVLIGAGVVFAKVFLP